MRLPSRISFTPTLRTPRSHKNNKKTLRIRIPDLQAIIRSRENYQIIRLMHKNKVLTTQTLWELISTTSCITTLGFNHDGLYN
jgi:hypothetical protein